MLVAQQASPQTADAAPAAESTITAAAAIPGSTRIELAPVDAPIDEGAQVGSSVRFAIASAVLVDGVTAIPAGTPVTAFVTDSRHGSHRIANDGKLTIRARDLRPGKALLVRVRDNPLLLAPYGPIPWKGQGGAIAPVAIVAAVVLIAVLGMRTH
jgi:hypothetical protein